MTAQTEYMANLMQPLPSRNVAVIPVGAKITCENGHPICSVMEELKRQFGEWKAKEPSRAQPLPILCGICSAPWVGFSGRMFGGRSIHVEGIGWWPHPPMTERLCVVEKTSQRAKKHWLVRIKDFFL